MYPADSPARSAFSASAVASPALGTASASKLRPPRAASSGGKCRTIRSTHLMYCILQPRCALQPLYL